MGNYTGGHNARYLKQIDQRTSNRSAALGRPAMKSRGGGDVWVRGASTSLRSTNPRP